MEQLELMDQLMAEHQLFRDTDEHWPPRREDPDAGTTFGDEREVSRLVPAGDARFAAEVGLTNVQTHCGSIAGYDGCAQPTLCLLSLSAAGV